MLDIENVSVVLGGVKRPVRRQRHESSKAVGWASSARTGRENRPLSGRLPVSSRTRVRSGLAGVTMAVPTSAPGRARWPTYRNGRSCLAR